MWTEGRPHQHSVRLYDETLWKKAQFQAVKEGILISELVRRAIWLYVSDPSVAAGILKQHPDVDFTPKQALSRRFKKRMEAELAAVKTTDPPKSPSVETVGKRDPHGLGF